VYAGLGLFNGTKPYPLAFAAKWLAGLFLAAKPALARAAGLKNTFFRDIAGVVSR
jgi:hypothetical protein